MEKRINILKITLKNHGIDALLVTDPANLFYLSGYTGSNGMLIVQNNQSKPIFYTDFRYKEQTKDEIKDCRVKILNRNLFSGFPVDDIKSIKRFGFEANSLCFGNYQRVKKTLKGKVKLIPIDECVENLRMIKDVHELEKIRTAVAITDKVFENILKLIKPRITEKELALEIDYQFKKEGDIAFPAIVAFSERGAFPHAQPTNKRLKMGDVIVFDMGAKFQNYCADMTRTIVLGKASIKVKKIYDIVLTAQKSAEEKITAGKSGAEIDNYARNYIKAKGYGEFFGHGLGHGVGIAVHEKPALSSINNDALKPNVTVTVEPGIYLPGEFGIRIEDLVVVKEKGREILTKSPKELIEL